MEQEQQKEPYFYLENKKFMNMGYFKQSKSDRLKLTILQIRHAPILSKNYAKH